MMLEQLAYLAEIVGVILIIASLAYVALQVRQNTEAQLASSREASLSADMTLVSALIANPEVVENSVKNRSELSFSEQEQVGNLMAGFVRTREFAWTQYRNGVMDKATMESYVGTLVRAISYGELTRDYWSCIRKRLNPHSSVTLIHYWRHRNEWLCQCQVVAALRRSPLARECRLCAPNVPFAGTQILAWIVNR